MVIQDWRCKVKGTKHILVFIVVIAMFNHKLDSIKEEDKVNDDDVPNMKSQDFKQQDLPVDTVRKLTSNWNHDYIAFS